MSLEGFRMYTHYGRVGAIPTQRVYQLSDKGVQLSDHEGIPQQTFVVVLK